MSQEFRRCLVVGVTAHQPPAVIATAARFAGFLGAVVIAAHVQTGHYVTAEHPDGSVESRPIDPDLPEWDTAVFDPDLAARIRAQADAAGVPVELRELAGDIGHALGRLAEVLDAELIIVGSRRGRAGRTTVHEFFSGSVAVHLAHRQPRPVLVVPLAPQPQGRLPWEHPRP